MRNWKLLGVFVLSLAPVMGFAVDELSYSYVQASYVDVDVDDFDVDADGFALNASGLVGENIFLFGGYSNVESDDFSLMGATVSVENETISAGLGYRMPLQSGTDLNASLAFIKDDIKASASGPGGTASESEDDTGFGLSVGVRHLFTPQFEGGASIDYVDIYDDSDTAFSVSALFHATESWSFGADYTFGGDADVLGIGARFNF